MKLIIAGTRNGATTLDDVSFAIMEYGLVPDEIVSGGSGDVDGAGEMYAHALNLPKKVFIAHWSQHGRAAGPIRNTEMANYADALLAFWDGKSRGTANMIENMKRRGKPVYIVAL